MHYRGENPSPIMCVCVCVRSLGPQDVQNFQTPPVVRNKFSSQFSKRAHPKLKCYTPFEFVPTEKGWLREEVY